MSTCTPLAATRLLYFKDGKTLKGVAHLVKYHKGDPDGNGTKLDIAILDGSHFYPQGGGQPADTGVLRSTQWSFHVTMAKMDPVEHHVHLHGQMETGQCAPVDSLPQRVEYEIDAAKRALHCRIHSAGHVLDIALLDMLGYASTLTAQKGYHFPQGPYIEYGGKLPYDNEQEKKHLIRTIEDECNTLVATGANVLIVFDDPEYVDPHTVTRSMQIEGHPRQIACGGTHVAVLSDIGPMTIRKLEYKAATNTTRISYAVSDVL